MIAVLPDNFAQLLLGSAVAAGSVLIAVFSLWTAVRRHRAEKHFLTVLTTSMRKTFTPDKRVVLQHAQEGELTEKEKEELRGVAFGALPKLDPTDKDFIQKALKQPSPRGRENYERKILSEGARRALREPQTTDTAGKDTETVEKQARPTLSKEPRPSTEQNESPSLGGSKRARGTISVRRNVYSLSQDGPEIAALRKGIAAMMSRDPSDPTSWSYQANIYGTTDTPPDQQAGRLWNQASHANYFFLSWNRMYLYFFERILRAASGDPNLAVPYWDYSNSAQRALPTAFRQPADASNPLYVAQRDPGINQGFLLPASSASHSPAFNAVAFFVFGGEESRTPTERTAYGMLERMPHNTVHVVVGGKGGWMSRVTDAARDPVFLVHHANVDRLWKRWLDQGGGRHNPVNDSVWMNTPFTFVDEHGQLVTMSGRDILDTVDQLGYRYDDDPPSDISAPFVGVATAPAEAGQSEGRTARTLLGESKGGGIIELGAEATTIPIKLGDDAKDEVATLTQTQAEAVPIGSRILLSLEDIQYAATSSVFYEVYINLPEDQEPDWQSEYYVGTLTLGFESTEPISEVNYDITDNVLTLAERGEWAEDHISLTFIPLPALPQVGIDAEAEASSSTMQTEPSERPRIKRITVTSAVAAV